jgi:hypothetical protein
VASGGSPPTWLDAPAFTADGAQVGILANRPALKKWPSRGAAHFRKAKHSSVRRRDRAGRCSLARDRRTIVGIESWRFVSKEIRRMPDEHPIVLPRPRRKPATKRMLICRNCGAEFLPSRIDAKWCSRRCQSYAWATGQNAVRTIASSDRSKLP